MKLNRVFRISILFFILIFLHNYSYCKYNIVLDENIINLKRDTEISRYIIEYSETDYTNQDVEVYVTFEKEIDYLVGFEKIDDYNFKKTYPHNVNERLIFEDYSGNKSTVHVEINNIDKEMPVIIGLDDITSLPIHLDYTDNIGIRSIKMEKYSDNLDFRVLDDFYDVDTFYGVDSWYDYINCIIIGRPTGTKMYKYYLNNVLQAYTENTSFTFYNLNPNTTYRIKVEAIDENGNVIKSREKNSTTQCFKNVTEYKTDSLGVISFSEIMDQVETVKVQIYSDENPNYIMYANIPYNKSTHKFTFVFNSNTFRYTNHDYIYRIHFYFYDANGRQVSVFPYNLMFGVEAMDMSLENDDVYNITQKGKYKIIVEDLAGNVLIKEITIE